MQKLKFNHSDTEFTESHRVISGLLCVSVYSPWFIKQVPG